MCRWGSLEIPSRILLGEHTSQHRTAVPVPTEDTALTIPGAFLLQNDISGRSTTLDENNFFNGNDGNVSLQSVTAVTPGLVVTLDSSGNVQVTPPDDVYGNVVFTYVAVDQVSTKTLGELALRIR